jgi:hypothetical protein
MMILILFLLSLPALMLAVAAVIAVPLTVLDYIEELYHKVVECSQLHKYRKRERERLAYEIRVWTIIAKECDGNTQAEDKGYAIARLINYQHQLDMLG